MATARESVDGILSSRINVLEDIFRRGHIFCSAIDSRKAGCTPTRPYAVFFADISLGPSVYMSAVSNHEQHLSDQINSQPLALSRIS